MERTSEPVRRYSASQIPADADPAEKDFFRLLERALAPSYTLVKRLGAGGMGAVYLARDPVLKRLVAVKVMAPTLAADEASRARFEREAQAVASISHPNVVSVFSVGELENGVPYLVMQYIEGRTMADRLKETGPLDVRVAKRVLGEVASALVAAHRKGVIHRDIKPANILWDDDTGRVLVTDFGIAAVLERGDERDATRITHTGLSVGTPAYMSPEQLLAEPVTEKTDIYSLGLLGYELLIAEGPYQLSSPREVMAAHLRDTPRRLTSMRADVDPELDRLLESCLAKDPKQRPAAKEVESRLAHGTSVLLEWPPPGLEKLRTSLRMTRRTVLLGALVTGIPLAAVSLFDRESFVRLSLPPMLAVLALTAVGLIVFLAGLGSLGRFLLKARKGVAAGYGWGTVLEVVADERGDTGALIAGAREYAELTPEMRSSMRQTRVVALVLRLIAAVVPVVGYVAGVLVAARSAGGPVIVLWSSILLSFSLLVAARLILMQEDRAMAEARRRLHTVVTRSEGMQRLAPGWMATFEQVRVGQKLGGGSRRHGGGVGSVTTALLALAALSAFAVFMVFFLTVAIRTAAEISTPKFGAARSKITKVQRLAVYRAPVDSSISPLRAGQAMHAIVADGPQHRLSKWEKALPFTIPAQNRTPPTTDPFASQGGWGKAAFIQAPRGFTVAQRDFLRATADNTALEEFRLLARAPSLDFPAAFLDIQPGSEPPYYELPAPRYMALRVASNANTAQAALDLSAGRTQEAERRIRESISVGFLMINDGRMLMENLIGSALVSNARLSLSALYQVTGRTRESRAISPEEDPVVTILDQEIGGRVTVDELNQMLNRVILDDTEVLGLRWELLLGSFAWTPCTDMHQVIFGPDSLHVAVTEEARRKLVRRPSDEMLFGMMERGMKGTAGERTGRTVWSAHRPIARLVTAMTGNRQLEGCLALLGYR